MSGLVKSLFRMFKSSRYFNILARESAVSVLDFLIAVKIAVKGLFKDPTSLNLSPISIFPKSHRITLGVLYGHTWCDSPDSQ
jgi:hypothetical protein